MGERSFDLRSFDLWSFDRRSFDLRSFDLRSFNLRSLDLRSFNIFDLLKRSTVIELISSIFEKDWFNLFQDRIDLWITKNNWFDKKCIWTAPVDLQSNWLCRTLKKIDRIDSIFFKIEAILWSQKQLIWSNSQIW